MTRGNASALKRSKEGPTMAPEQDSASLHDIELHEPLRLSPRTVLLGGLLLVVLVWWLAGGMQAAAVLWAQATIWLTGAIR